MSVKAIGRIWEMKLDHSSMIVLMAYADHADHNGENIFPSIELIAWKTGYSGRQVRRITRRLEVKGLLKRSGSRPSGESVFRIDFSAAEMKPDYKSELEKRRRQRADKMSGQAPAYGVTADPRLARSGDDKMAGHGADVQDLEGRTSKTAGRTNGANPSLFMNRHGTVNGNTPPAPSRGRLAGARRVGVATASKFTKEQRKRYAAAQLPTLGKGWLAESRSGKYDELVEDFFAEPQIDSASCVRCRGSGVWVDPDRDWLGSQICSHPGLGNGIRPGEKE